MKLGFIHRQSWGRSLVLTLVYVVVLLLAWWMAFLIRFDFLLPPRQQEQMLAHWPWQLAIKLAMLLVFGQFSGLLSYFSLPDLTRLLYACATSSGLIAFVRFMNSSFVVPRSVLLTDFMFSFAALVGVRMGFRILRERFLAPKSAVAVSGRARRVGIIGADDVGANLAKELMSRRGLGLEPVAFFDDHKSKWNKRVHGIPVLGAPEQLLNPKLNLKLDEVIIATPEAPAKRIGEVVRILQQARLRYESVPALEQLATGKVKVSQLREVEIQDLLGRSPVQIQTDHIRELLQGQVVMVTGAGGSIGSELCRQILNFNPERVLLLEQSEFLLFQIEQELREAGAGGEILPLVGDVCDQERLNQIFARFKPSIVFHAAAHKHVPMMENQPAEAVQNNTFGTARLAETSLAHGVRRFILISTDKAINPTNVMGATKRLAEIFLQSLDAAQADRNSAGTRFMAVRFGNVLGSSGSVIPTFRKQIAAGGPVKVTHPDVTRYFMTIPEAVGLVLQSATQGTGGEIFVLDMGQPVKIVDLARQLIELSGHRPGDDILIEYTGLRPGEKLFEELSHKGENITTTSHPKIMRFVCQPAPLDSVRTTFATIAHQMHEVEANVLKMRLHQAVPEYRPYLAES